jgi:hypothetical protein
MSASFRRCTLCDEPTAVREIDRNGHCRGCLDVLRELAASVPDSDDDDTVSYSTHES